MENKTILKLKKRMELGAKTIANGDRAIEAIKKTQAKVSDDFGKEVMAVVKKSQKEIDYHQNVIAEARNLTL